MKYHNLLMNYTVVTTTSRGHKVDPPHSFGKSNSPMSVFGASRPPLPLVPTGSGRSNGRSCWR